MSSILKSRRAALLSIAIPLVGARLAVVGFEPRRRVVDELPEINIERDVPLKFGRWANAAESSMQVVNPTLTGALADAYDQAVSRVYRSSYGPIVKLSIAYGSNQRSKKLHMPANCYGAQGYRVSTFGSSSFPIGGRSLPVSTFAAAGPGTMGEMVAYWVVYGSMLGTNRLQGRYELFKQEVEGLIPDGILCRVSVDVPNAADDVLRQQGTGILADYVGALHASMQPAQAGRYFPVA